MQLEMRELEASHSSLQPDQQKPQLIYQQFAKLEKFSSELESRAEAALMEFSNGMVPGENDLIAMENERLAERKPPREFCYGAKLLQLGEKSDSYVDALAAAAPSKSGWGYICKFCRLEVGYYPAVRLTVDGKALESSKLLTASHLVACKSLLDHRAFYRCLACFKRNKIIEFPSAMAFEKHMEQHFGFTLLQKSEEDRLAERVKAKENDMMVGIVPSAYGPEETIITTPTFRDTPVIQKPHPEWQQMVQDENIRSEVSAPEEYRNSVHESANEPKENETRPAARKKGFQATFAQDIRHLQEERSESIPGTYPQDLVEADSISIPERASGILYSKAATETAEFPAENLNINSVRQGERVKQSRRSGKFGQGQSLESEFVELPLGFIDRPSDFRREVMSPEPQNLLIRNSLPQIQRHSVGDAATSPATSKSVLQPPSRTGPTIPPKVQATSSKYPLTTGMSSRKPSESGNIVTDETGKRSSLKSSSDADSARTETDPPAGRQPVERWIFDKNMYKCYRGDQVVKQQEGFPLGEVWVYSKRGWHNQEGNWASWRAESQEFVFSVNPE
jgi:hypothetical protein